MNARNLRLALIDAGGANLFSVASAFKRLGIDAQITQDKATIRNASHVVLPGVGHIAEVMQNLNRLDLKETLCHLNQAFLGICVGMQAMYEESEEFFLASKQPTACLGMLPHSVKRMKATPPYRIPHMGWNEVVFLRAHPLLANVDNRQNAYFVHSFAADVNAQTSLAQFHYGPEGDATFDYTAICLHPQKENQIGIQFHPERSGSFGLQLLKNFVENMN